ncbi:MAG TPA: MlaA family lipoprotein [Burkholderiales bacterium]|nr:MlaA family lipoprotein [Burkholderiales bacterium]
MPRSMHTLALSLLLSLSFLGGCATTNPRDPLEPMNRAVYTFNDGVDTVLFRPLAEGYKALLPSFVRVGISNFFANINDILISLNNLLQGKVVNAISDLGRVAVNSTMGVGGFFDVATHFGMEKHDEDFGQTLGYWGIGDGPYLVLPIFGPSNLRDTIGRVVDAKGDPIGYLHSIRLRNSLWGLRQVNQRAELLDTSRILETAALDPYEFLRDAYLQRRRSLVHDGAPPREKDEDTDSNPLTLKPRASSPFPSSVEADTMLPGTPWAGADNSTPARAATQEATFMPVAKRPPAQAAAPETGMPAMPASVPQYDVMLPTKRTAAGMAAAEVQQRVTRVWAPAAD